MDVKIERILKELEGVHNTIWAYKFEFHDLDETTRIETLKNLDEKERLLKAKIKAIELKDKLSNL